MLADEDGEVRLSLAGAQDKLPVVVDADGRVGITSGRTPSTHILKMPIARFAGTVVNEAFCLALGRAARRADGGRVAAPRTAAAPYLLVRRYDRDARRPTAASHACTRRTSARRSAIPSERKYEVEGGPSLVDCFAARAARDDGPRGAHARAARRRRAQLPRRQPRRARQELLAAALSRRARSWRPSTTCSARSPTRASRARRRWRSAASAGPTTSSDVTSTASARPPGSAARRFAGGCWRWRGEAPDAARRRARRARGGRVGRPAARHGPRRRRPARVPARGDRGAAIRAALTEPGLGLGRRL